MTYLFFGGWVLVCGYATIPAFWLAIHPFAGYWRTWRRSPYLALLPFWALMVAAAMAVTWPWYGVRLYETPWSWAPAAVLFASAIFVYYGAHKHISNQQVMGRAELEPAKHEQKLVSTGMHARVRHPLYLGHLCMLLGWTVATGWIALYGLTGFAVLSGWAMIYFEERELEKRFGEEYREYKRRVPALVPRFR